MPDLFLVLIKRWKFIGCFTLGSLLMALVFVLVSPKKYLSVNTAIPVNSAVGDKARILNSNIQALYSDFGSADELDRMEGTASLDTLYIAVSNEFNLADHYGFTSHNGHFKAALKFKKNSSVKRSPYGELKIKVWDTDPILASRLANSFFEKLQQLQQHLQNQNNVMALQELAHDEALKKKIYQELTDSLGASMRPELLKARKEALLAEIEQDEKLMNEYELAVNANPRALLTVENARPSLWPDIPKIPETMLFTFFASFIFSYLLSVFLESRK